MEPRAHHILIGLFTVTACAAALMFALWLGKSESDQEYNHYNVVFDRAVTGLAVGNAVLYRGIKVGDVRALNFDPKDPSLVVARIRVQIDIPVKEDTTATLELANITGSMSIQLKGGSGESPPLAGPRDQPPVIPADPSPISAIIAQGENILNNLDQFLENANRLVSEENTSNLNEIVTNLKLATDTLTEQRSNLTDGLTQFNQLMTEATSLTRQLDGLVDEQGEQVLTSARQTMEAVEQLLVQNEGALNEGIQNFNELGPAIRELRNTLNAVQRLTQRLEENPSDLIFGGEQIKEFNP